jgi:hypothetical protein
LQAHISDSCQTSNLPFPEFAYSEEIWKGLCETCLSSAKKTYLNTGQPRPFREEGNAHFAEKFQDKTIGSLSQDTFKL